MKPAKKRAVKARTTKKQKPKTKRPSRREMSWSEFMASTGAPGKPCKHCGKEGDCRCAE